VWQTPDAVDTVVCAPDDGWMYHPKHVEQFPDKINGCNAASCWIYIRIFLRRTDPRTLKKKRNCRGKKRKSLYFLMWIQKIWLGHISETSAGRSSLCICKFHTVYDLHLKLITSGSVCLNHQQHSQSQENSQDAHCKQWFVPRHVISTHLSLSVLSPLFLFV